MDGDENTKYFHSILKKRRRRLEVSSVMVGGSWLSAPNQGKDVFFNFFRDKFQPFQGIDRQNLSPRLTMLDMGIRENLLMRFSRSEVKTTVWCSGSDMPGSDGFTFSFIKKYLNLLKLDVLVFVEEFFDFVFIPKGCNSSFITVIAKVDNLIFMKDYRTISMIGVQYKLLLSC